MRTREWSDLQREMLTEEDVSGTPEERAQAEARRSPPTPVVAIIMPVREWVHTNTNRSILRLKVPKPVHYLDKTDAPVEAARNMLTAGALRDIPDLTHLLFIDDDMVFDSDAFERLLAHDLPIVGGLCHNRRPPYMPILMREYNGGYTFVYDYDREIDSRGLIEVDATGAAFLLVRKEVFEKIASTGEEPFAIRGPGEDISFCLRAKEQGYKIYVDTTVEIGHVGEVTVTNDFARRNRDFVIFPWVDAAKRPPVGVTPGIAPPPARMRGDEISLEARRARARYAFAGQEIAKRVRVGEVLDFGCGTGYGCSIIAREALIRGSRVVVGGYDPDALAIAFGRETFWPHLTGDASEALSGELAAVVCLNVLQHVTDPDGLLRALISSSPLVIVSVPYEKSDLVNPPGSVTVLNYGQQADGNLGGSINPTTQDLIFVITR